MSRSVWFAVMVTALILSAAGLLANGENRAAIARGARSAGSAIARSGSAGSEFVSSGIAHSVVGHSGVVRAIGSKDVLPWIGILGGLIALTIAGLRGSRLVRFSWARRPRSISPIRQGPSISGIARRRRMSQDAVRTMMRAEMAPARRAPESGKSFRSAPPSFASELQSRLRPQSGRHYEQRS